MSSSAQREEEIFAGALQLPADRRGAYLAEACGDASALRLRIEGLLRALERASPLLREPSATLFARTLPISPPTEKPGDKIGRYKLLEQIGEGGCGVVYVAEQEEPVRRRVALKVIKLGMDTKQVIARFDAERQALAMMDHPNIAKIHDAGVTETGRPYFVMELVRGIKITDYCDQNHLPPRERLDLFIQVCRAIQHAHQKGIIHRDIKPSNILVASNDGSPLPKVIDFGIAKATQGRLTDQTVYTAFEQFIGTPAYMSPEQAAMTMLDIDTRTDIYSLGVLLYELLTGTTPFDAKELLAKGLDEMRRTIREVEPVKPSTRLTQELQRLGSARAPRAESDASSDSSSTNQKSFEESQAHEVFVEATKTVRGARALPKSALRTPHSAISSDLDWIVMKCLEKDRTRRYETANGLATDISRHLSNEPVVARPPSRLYRFQKSIQRNKLAFGAATAVALALITGLVVSTAMYFKAQVEKRNAQAEKTKAQTESAKSQQVVRFLQEMLDEIGPRKANGRDTELLRRILEKTAARAVTELTNQPEVEAELLERVGTVYTEIGPLDKAEWAQHEALRIRKQLFGTNHLAAASSLYELGFTYWRQGKNADAESVLREALATQRRLLNNDDAQINDTLLRLGGVVLERKPAEAEAVLRELVERIRKKYGDDSSSLMWPLTFLGRALDAQRKRLQAESTFREALAVARKLGIENLSVAEAHRSLGETLQRGGKLAEAEDALRAALELHRKVSDQERSPHLAWTLDYLAKIADKQGRLGDVEELIKESFSIKKRALGEQHANTIGTANDLVDVLRRRGKLSEAETLGNETVANARHSASNKPALLRDSVSQLARVLREQKKDAEAEALLKSQSSTPSK